MSALFITAVRHVLIGFTLVEDTPPAVIVVHGDESPPLSDRDIGIPHQSTERQQQPVVTPAVPVAVTRPPQTADLIDVQLGDASAECRARHHLRLDLLDVPRRAVLPSHCDDDDSTTGRRGSTVDSGVRERDRQCRPLPTCRDVLLDPASADDLATRPRLVASKPTDAQLVNWTRTATADDDDVRLYRNTSSTTTRNGDRSTRSHDRGRAGMTPAATTTAAGGCAVWKTMFRFDRDVEISDDEIEFPIAFNLLVHTDAYQVRSVRCVLFLSPSAHPLDRPVHFHNCFVRHIRRLGRLAIKSRQFVTIVLICLNAEGSASTERHLSAT